MSRITAAAAAAALLATSALANDRPIIGILTMPSSYSAYKNQSFFPSSYVKFLEQGGARVVPIPYDLQEAALKELLSHINGALFTGGAAGFFSTSAPHEPTPYATTAAAIYAESVNAAAAGESECGRQAAAFFSLRLTCCGCFACRYALPR